MCTFGSVVCLGIGSEIEGKPMDLSKDAVPKYKQVKLVGYDRNMKEAGV